MGTTGKPAHRPCGCPGRKLVAIALAAGLQIAPASAANQDEIQVYDDSINKPGQFGLELHLNATPLGRAYQLYPGEITNEHGFRVTPEFSYGLTKDLELGFYLDTEKDGEGNYHFVGPKYRLKWLPFQAEANGGFFSGANVEDSRVGRRFSESRNGLELRLMDGYHAGDWLIVANPVFDWDLSDGLESGDPNFSASLKVTRKVMEGVAAGIEYYGDLGKFTHISPWEQQDQRIYAVVDFDMKPFVFNLGVGMGLTSASDASTVKGMWEVPVDEILKR